jgi:hypothetical protein
MRRRTAFSILGWRALFDERVPRAAVGAAAQPFWGLRSALLTHKDGLRGFGHLVIWLTAQFNCSIQVTN